MSAPEPHYVVIATFDPDDGELMSVITIKVDPVQFPDVNQWISTELLIETPDDTDSVLACPIETDDVRMIPGDHGEMVMNPQWVAAYHSTVEWLLESFPNV